MTQSYDRALMDATCPKCRQHIGWYGTVLERPACPRCGHRIDKAALQADHDKVAEFRRLLALDPHKAAGADLRAQRIVSGLTLRQAATLLDLAPTGLSRFEQGIDKPDDALATKIGKVYGMGPDQEGE